MWSRPRPLACIRDEDIDSTPLLDHPRDHCLDRLMVTDIDLDAYGNTARSLDLGDGGVRRHVLGLGLEFLIRAQVEVGDRDLGTPIRRGASREPVRDHALRRSRQPLCHPAFPFVAPCLATFFATRAPPERSGAPAPERPQLAGGYGKGAVKCDALTPFWNVNHLTIDIISYILSQIPATCRPRQ
jgi:hypothetical protein